MGEEGLTRLARINHAKAGELGRRVFRALPGVELVTPSFFNEFTLKLPKPRRGVVDALAAKGVLARRARLAPDAA